MSAENNAVHLWDLVNENVYVKLNDNFRSKLFTKAIKTLGNGKLVAKLLKIDYQRFYKFKKGKHFIRLKILYRMVNECNLAKLKQDVEPHIEEIKLGPNGNPIKNPKLPLIFSLKISQISGHIIGDGCIKRDNILCYTNKSEYLINELVEAIRNEVGEVNHSSFYNTVAKDVRTVVFPGIVGLLFKRLIGPQYGKLKHIPNIILNSNVHSKSLFLRALFDDESSVSVSAYCIHIKMTGKNLVNNIKKLLKELGIKSGKIAKTNDKWRPRYILRLSGKQNLIAFRDLIGFAHPEKREKLNMMINQYQIYRLYELRSLIPNILKENGNMKVFELAKRLSRKDTTRFREHLLKLEKEGLINSSREGKFKVYFIS